MKTAIDAQAYGSEVSATYITFRWQRQPSSVSGTATRTLRVTVAASGNDLVALLTKSREPRFSPGAVLMTMRRANTGFVLIELVTTLVLVGVIGTFAAFFLYNGMNGYLVSKRNSETALIAQVAMDRISAELRFVSALPGVFSATSDSITYFSNDFPTTPRRRLCYDSAAKAVLLSVNAQPTLQLCGYGAENGRF